MALPNALSLQLYFSTSKPDPGNVSRGRTLYLSAPGTSPRDDLFIYAEGYHSRDLR